MNSRRKFLVQGSMATTAMLALKPFSAIAKATSPFTGFGGSYNKLGFLHTVNKLPDDYKITRYIKNIKDKNENTILLKAGQDKQDETGGLTYDVSVLSDDYKIINKGKFRTGIISAMPGESNVVQKINTISAYLKKEKNCTIVVCLSQLGYKNKNTPDDITLANKSTDLDIIIGGHTDNYHNYPVVALNKNDEEVIIHSALGDASGFGLIDIEFDSKNKKKLIHISGKLSNN